MKLINLTGLVCLSLVTLAQDVHFNYDRSANFNAYRTYQWVDLQAGRASNQLLDQNIKRAIDEQLVGKKLQRVGSGGDLQIAYQVGLDREKQYDAFRMGPLWNGMAQVNSSTIEIGKLVVDLFDPARNQLVWRGDAAKTLDIKKTPDK